MAAPVRREVRVPPVYQTPPAGRRGTWGGDRTVVGARSTDRHVGSGATGTRHTRWSHVRRPEFRAHLTPTTTPTTTATVVTDPRSRPDDRPAPRRPATPRAATRRRHRRWPCRPAGPGHRRHRRRVRRPVGGRAALAGAGGGVDPPRRPRRGLRSWQQP